MTRGASREETCRKCDNCVHWHEAHHCPAHSDGVFCGDERDDQSNASGPNEASLCWAGCCWWAEDRHPSEITGKSRSDICRECQSCALDHAQHHCPSDSTGVHCGIEDNSGCEEGCCWRSDGRSVPDMVEHGASTGEICQKCNSCAPHHTESEHCPAGAGSGGVWCPQATPQPTAKPTSAPTPAGAGVVTPTGVPTPGLGVATPTGEPTPEPNGGGSFIVPLLVGIGGVSVAAVGAFAYRRFRQREAESNKSNKKLLSYEEEVE